MLRGIITFVIVFALLALLLGLFGWAGPLEVLLLIVAAALVTIGVIRVGASRRNAR